MTVDISVEPGIAGPGAVDARHATTTAGGGGTGTKGSAGRVVLSRLSEWAWIGRAAGRGIVNTPRFEVDTAGHTEGEQLTLAGHAWHRLDELDALPEPVWPVELARLAALERNPELWPVDLGEIEESTVPVG